MVKYQPFSMIQPVIYTRETIQSSARPGWTTIPTAPISGPLCAHRGQTRRARLPSFWSWLGLQACPWCFLAPCWFPFPFHSLLRPPSLPPPIWCPVKCPSVASLAGSGSQPFLVLGLVSHSPYRALSLQPCLFISHLKTTTRTLSDCPVSSLNRNLFYSPLLAVLDPRGVTPPFSASSRDYFRPNWWFLPK